MLISGISEERKIRHKRYQHLNDRWRSLSAEILLRYVLYLHYGLIGDEIIFTYNSNGKPLLYNHTYIYFNILHYGEWILCGVSDVPIGIDIERISNIDISLANRFFHEKECLYISQHSETEQIKAFFQIRTLKECKH